MRVKFEKRMMVRYHRGRGPSETRPRQADRRRDGRRAGRQPRRREKAHSEHPSLAECVGRPKSDPQREDRAPAPTTRSARVSRPPHPLHTKLLRRPSASGSNQSLSHHMKTMISPHPQHASARRPDTSTLVMPMTFSSSVVAPCPEPNGARSVSARSNGLR
jgi:hypothetical protein